MTKKQFDIQQWEYTSAYYGVHEIAVRNFPDYLNQQGQLGWELIQIIIERMRNDPNEHANYTFLFKRKIN